MASRPTTPPASPKQTQPIASRPLGFQDANARQTFRAAKPANSAHRSPKNAAASKCILDPALFLSLHPSVPAPSRISDKFRAQFAQSPDPSGTYTESRRSSRSALGLL